MMSNREQLSVFTFLDMNTVWYFWVYSGSRNSEDGDRGDKVDEVGSGSGSDPLHRRFFLEFTVPLMICVTILAQSWIKIVKIKVVISFRSGSPPLVHSSQLPTNS